MLFHKQNHLYGWFRPQKSEQMAKTGIKQASFGTKIIKIGNLKVFNDLDQSIMEHLKIPKHAYFFMDIKVNLLPDNIYTVRC